MSFRGAHQAGITTPAPTAAVFVSFDVIAEDRTQLAALLRTITERARFLTTGGTPVDLGVGAPPSDSGLLGPDLPADDLTVTVGVGASLDDRYGLTGRMPRHLKPMRTFPTDGLDAAECHGDLSLQLCAANSDTVLHALRDITRHTRGAMQIKWRIDGFQNPSRPTGAQRNFLGFKDGIANPDTASSREMDKLVLGHRSRRRTVLGGRRQLPGHPDHPHAGRVLGPGLAHRAGEDDRPPPSTRRTAGQQLQETDLPRYTKDPKGEAIPLDAHIRLANPRTAKTDTTRILRRGYNYDRGVDKAGNLDMGLAFCSYQQDVVRRVRGDPDASDRRAARRLHQPDRGRLLLRAARGEGQVRLAGPLPRGGLKRRVNRGLGRGRQRSRAGGRPVQRTEQKRHHPPLQQGQLPLLVSTPHLGIAVLRGGAVARRQ